MPNTTLPQSIFPGDPNFIPHVQVAWTEINRLTRDTGLRNASGLLANGWTLAAGGFVRIRRVDDDVTLYVNGLVGTAATSNIFMNLGSAGGQLSANFGPHLEQGTTMSPTFRQTGSDTQPWWLYYAVTSSNARQLAIRTFDPAVRVGGTGDTTVQWSWKSYLDWPATLPPAV